MVEKQGQISHFFAYCKISGGLDEMAECRFQVQPKSRNSSRIFRNTCPYEVTTISDLFFQFSRWQTDTHTHRQTPLQTIPDLHSLVSLVDTNTAVDEGKASAAWHGSAHTPQILAHRILHLISTHGSTRNAYKCVQQIAAAVFLTRRDVERGTRRRKLD